MALIQPVRELLEQERIECAAPLPSGLCRIRDPAKLERRGFPEGSVRSILILLVPYHPGKAAVPPDRNLSVYAFSRDYHLFFRELFGRIIPSLSQIYPGYRFEGFSDNSPISEQYAAACAGLGVLGDNGLIISRRYGSYVFLAEVFSDLPPDRWGEVRTVPPQTCLHCGACRDACPMNREQPPCPGCLSELTQKKKDLPEETPALIRHYRTVWGCDLCQEACPLNAAAEPTPIPFFQTDLIPRLTSERLNRMTEEELSERAFGWRGRKPIARNVAILEASPDTVSGSSV